MKSAELTAYAAGLFEGEGHLCAQWSVGRSGHRSYSLAVMVKMTDPEPLHELAEAWGGTLKRHTRGGVRKPITDWQLAGPPAAVFLHEISPHLRVQRRIDAVRLALEFQAQKRNTGRWVTDEYRAAQASYAQRIRDANNGVVA